MLYSRLLLIVLFVTAGFVSFASAQNTTVTEKDRAAFQKEANIWLDTVFGHCLFQISGETFSDHPAELRGKWKALRSDYSSTLVKPLYKPKESALRRATILDISPSGESCWTQHSTIVPDYVTSRLSTIQQALAKEDRLKSAYVDQGNGPQQVAVILIGAKRVPVILYQSVSQQNGFVDVTMILQKTVPGFVYSD